MLFILVCYFEKNKAEINEKIKNREIRKMMKFFGLEVSRLIRISYGPYQLGLLKPGQVQEAPCA